MTTIASRAPEPARTSLTSGRSRRPRNGRHRGKWWRFTLLMVITVITLIPIFVTILLAVQPTGGGLGFTLRNFQNVITQTSVGLWMSNSLQVTTLTVIVSVIVAAPAGYVLSRGRGRAVGAYSLLLFIIQSLPSITSVIPLFILFASIGLVDSLLGLTIVYVGSTMSVATWMMAAYFDSIPVSLEEAAWIDGCSVFGSFTRVVLRNSLPGILSTAIFSFLLAWNDYLVALVFVKSDAVFTLPVGLQTFFQQNQTSWPPVMACSVLMMLPPVIIFAFLNRYFSIGGIGGSLAGR